MEAEKSTLLSEKQSVDEKLTSLQGQLEQQVKKIPNICPILWLAMIDGMAKYEWLCLWRDHGYYTSTNWSKNLVWGRYIGISMSVSVLVNCVRFFIHCYLGGIS